MNRNVVVGLCLAVLAAFPLAAEPAPPSVRVRVVNPPSAPALVRDVDARAREPFDAHFEIILPPGAGGQNAAVAIPSGKRLVIEHASARGQVPAGQQIEYTLWTKLTTTSLLPHYLPVSQQYGVGLETVFIAGGPVRLYGDGDSASVYVRADRSLAQGTATVRLSLSGYLEDEP